MKSNAIKRDFILMLKPTQKPVSIGLCWLLSLSLRISAPFMTSQRSTPEFVRHMGALRHRVFPPDWVTALGVRLYLQLGRNDRRVSRLQPGDAHGCSSHPSSNVPHLATAARHKLHGRLRLARCHRRLQRCWRSNGAKYLHAASSFLQWLLTLIRC